MPRSSPDERVVAVGSRTPAALALTSPPHPDSESAVRGSDEMSLERSTRINREAEHLPWDAAPEEESGRGPNAVICSGLAVR
jgi:hypothetical protein